jgi:RepB DNA-primase from phage plasmid
MEIPQREALKLQLAAIIGSEPESSYIEIRPLEADGGIALRDRDFLPVRGPDAITRRVLELAPRLNVFIGVAPRTRQCGRADAVERVWTLWCDLDGRDALKRLATFRPLAGLVIRSGSLDCAHAYWPLRRPVSPDGAQRANRRLAQALGGDLAATDAARILRPAGTLNHKTDPPAEVRCTRLELDMFTLADVVGSLPDTGHYRPRPAVRQHFQGDPSSLLAGMVRTVSEAEHGNRNNALHWAACRVHEHHELDQAAALREIRAAALQAGLGEPEIKRTIASALAAKAAA